MSTAIESTIVMAVITIVAGVAMARDRVRRRVSWRARAFVGWLGVADALNVLLFFAAYKITIVASVLAHYLAPVFVAIAAPFALRERMTARSGVAIALSFGGLAVMFAPTNGEPASAAMWASAALGAGSAVFYASNVIVNKFVVESFSTSEAMFWHGVVATPLLAAVVPMGAWSTVRLPAAAFLAVVSIGPGALAGMAFVWGLRRMPAAHASTLTLLEPLVSVVVGIAVLGEAGRVATLFGGAGILAGALLVMTGSRPAPRPAG
jgi:drug/metabolite transporter (DMT)-like permease